MLRFVNMYIKRTFYAVLCYLLFITQCHPYGQPIRLRRTQDFTIYRGGSRGGEPGQGIRGTEVPQWVSGAKPR